MHEYESRDELPAPILEAARAYHTPPETPREELWQAIEAARRPRAASMRPATLQAPARTSPPLVVSQPRPKQPIWRFWASGGVAAAAVVALLLALPGGGTAPSGSLSERPSPVPPAAEHTGPGVDEAAVQLAVWDHLVRAEQLLALVHEELRAGDADAAVLQPSRDLLLDTRLLLDLAENADPALTDLLLALELALVQLAHVELNPTADEISFAAAELETAELLPRLHALVDPSRDDTAN